MAFAIYQIDAWLSKDSVEAMSRTQPGGAGFTYTEVHNGILNQGAIVNVMDKSNSSTLTDFLNLMSFRLKSTITWRESHFQSLMMKAGEREGLLAPCGSSHNLGCWGK